MLISPEWTQSDSRVAIVHDWLTGMRGGEAILDVICELFPKADLYALFWTDKKMSPNILNGRKVQTCYLQKYFPENFIRKKYRNLLPLFPHAISSFDLSQYDLVLSTSSCVAKGVQVNPAAIHISYIHSPMRYMWDLFDDYFSDNSAKSLLAKLIRKPMQAWDVKSTKNVDYLISNSVFVQSRIEKFWGRSSEVIFPFFDSKRFVRKERNPKDFYLIVSAFAPYKKIDMAVEACTRLKLPLKIVGSGQDEKKLREMANDQVEFLGYQTDEQINELYHSCKAFLLPGVEDFGITPVEAMNAGAPIIAFGEGGVLDTITEQTGILYNEQNVDALCEALEAFEANDSRFDSESCYVQANRFTREVFAEAYANFVAKSLVQGPRV